MKNTRTLILLLIVGMIAARAAAQGSGLTDQQRTQVEKAFALANELMEQRKYAEAALRYKEALMIVPDNPALLYNGGLAYYSSKDYATAADLWTHLKRIEPSDWELRARLIQVYQALNKTAERDAERQELFAMWKSGKSEELKKKVEYCRDQFEVKDQKVMAFELFELKGERALRYVFSILNAAGNGEEFRISLGSYEMDNAIWRETTKPTPKPGERLFHLDGYFKGGHATYGFYAPEPSYDQIRAKVIHILEGNVKPVSSSTVSPPPAAKPETKPKPQ